MENRTTGPARALAALALVAAFLAVVLVFATSLGGGDSEQAGGGGAVGGAITGPAQAGGSGEGAGRAPSSYVVQNGDTLTSIAAETGVSIERIQRLNPGIDPQILVSGQKLKLR